MTQLRPDLAIIAREISAGARVLDVGCGNGELMAALRDGKGVDARGVELDGRDVAACVARGLSVIQGDADIDLADYPDGAFDYAILSQTLQTTRRPDVVIDHLLRIGHRAFVSFPNFAQWRIRFAHMFGGRMPVTKQLPDRWYDTPNIHHVTIDDFRSFLTERDVKVEGQWFLTGNKRTTKTGANLFAQHAIFLLRRTGSDSNH
jgi:methionine biosynthesis protein MetW